MKEKIKYFSTDKMYRLNHFSNRRFNLKAISYCFLVATFFILFTGVFLINLSVDRDGNAANVHYSENGNADYTVHLKDNTFYETSYLTSGMQYVASLINTINTKFNYEIHSDKNVNFKYKYNITGNLQIVDPADSTKVLYTKTEKLLNEVTEETNSNNFVINEDVIIDYAKYNNYVNAYKREYGLSVDSKLILTMSIFVEGVSDVSSDNINKNGTLQITIPLSEQTVDIAIDTASIANSGYLSAGKGFVIKNYFLYIMGIITIVVSVICLIIAVKLFKEFNSFNIYNNTVNRILRDYDRLIVNGQVTIDESKYSNIVIPETFEEMVDASQNLKSPILFYEVIKGEKCFFVITKDDTLYKYRLTRAYLERKGIENNQNN